MIMKIKLIIVGICLLMIGCNNNRISYPITIYGVHSQGEIGCSIRLDNPDIGHEPITWTNATKEQCQYKIGDVLK